MIIDEAAPVNERAYNLILSRIKNRANGPQFHIIQNVPGCKWQKRMHTILNTPPGGVIGCFTRKEEAALKGVADWLGLEIETRIIKKGGRDEKN